MKVFVTGCAGLLGANYTRHLLHNGHEVVGIDNLSGGYKAFLAKGEKFEFVKLNLEKRKKVAQLFEEQRQRAVEHNKEVQDKIDALKEEVKQFGSDMAPKDYPEPYKTRWDKLQDWKKWEGSYPFNEENVKEFAEFCEQSGGFEIY